MRGSQLPQVSSTPQMIYREQTRDWTVYQYVVYGELRLGPAVPPVYCKYFANLVRVVQVGVIDSEPLQFNIPSVCQSDAR